MKYGDEREKETKSNSERYAEIKRVRKRDRSKCLDTKKYPDEEKTFMYIAIRPRNKNIDVDR